MFVSNDDGIIRRALQRCCLSVRLKTASARHRAKRFLHHKLALRSVLLSSRGHGVPDTPNPVLKSLPPYRKIYRRSPRCELRLMRAFISQVSDQEARLAPPRWPHEHCRPSASPADRHTADRRLHSADRREHVDCSAYRSRINVLIDLALDCPQPGQFPLCQSKSDNGMRQRLLADCTSRRAPR